MFFDAQDAVVADGMFSYPSWVFSNQAIPVPNEHPGPIGGSSSTTINIGGNIDGEFGGTYG